MTETPRSRCLKQPCEDSCNIPLIKTALIRLSFSPYLNDNIFKAILGKESNEKIS